jgi:hypothetical protein
MRPRIVSNGSLYVGERRNRVVRAASVGVEVTLRSVGFVEMGREYLQDSRKFCSET